MRRASSLIVHALCSGGIASLLVLLPLAQVACVTTDATTAIVPITGFAVRAEALVAARGCGTGATQVYKYAALVSGSAAKGSYADGGSGPVQLGLFDCFSDAVFANLPAYPTPTANPIPTAFTVQIFAFDQAMFAALSSDDVPVKNNVASRLAASDRTLDPTLLASLATWTSQCTASEVLNVESLAVCSPLVSAGAGTAQIPTASFAAGGDAGAPGLVCGTDYASVSGSAQVLSGDTTPGAPVPVAVTSCGGPIAIPAPGAPAEVDATLTLLSAAGAPVGSAQCAGVVLPSAAPTPLGCVLTSRGSASADAGSGDASADAGAGDASAEGGAVDAGSPVDDGPDAPVDGAAADAAHIDSGSDASTTD